MAKKDDEILPSVFDKKSWPYAGVEEELHLKSFEGKPYGSFNDWLLQLNLNINNSADYDTGHILLCLLNYAATHDNRIEDTRDFLGFLWWYNEKIKKMRRIDDTEKRRAAYQDLVYRIIEKTNYLSIDLFSPAGEIYSVSLLGKNSGISDYMAIKLKLQKHYIGIGDSREREFLGYLDLRDIDQAFFESLSDPEIYHAYIREFFLYELTPENIQELLAEPKFAVIKVPTKQTVFLTPEYLGQLTRIAFLKLSHVFTGQDGSVKNQEILNRIIEKVNAKNDKKYTAGHALEQMKESETLETDHEFWALFLEGITTCTQEEVEGTGNLLMYAFLLGAVLPEETAGAEERAITQLIKSKVEKADIAAFYTFISENKKTDYTFASFLEKFPELPFYAKYRGMEKEFIEQALDVLIRESHITKIREPIPRNISHFIVSKNFLTVFHSFMETIRDELMPKYREKLPENESEFRLDMEKQVSAGYPVFYQMYVRKEFADFVFRTLDKMDPADSSGYKTKMFISGAKEPAFLPLSELLGISYALLQTREILKGSETEKKPVEKEKPDAAVKPVKQENDGEKKNIEKDTEKEKKKEKPVTPDQKTVIEPEAVPPSDFIEVIILVFRTIGKSLKKIFGGIKTAMARSIEKDLERKKNVKTTAERSRQVSVKARKEKEQQQEQQVQVKEREAGKRDIELSLQAITKTMIEDFTGSKDLPIGEAVHSLAELWNDPKTIKKDEKDFIKNENIAKINEMINNNSKNLYAKTVTQARIMERASEIADFYAIGDMIKNLVSRKENKEIIKRYIALCLCMILLKK